jgi:hypothetical protein
MGESIVVGGWRMIVSSSESKAVLSLRMSPPQARQTKVLVWLNNPANGSRNRNIVERIATDEV